MLNAMFRPREGNEDMVGIWRVESNQCLVLFIAVVVVWAPHLYRDIDAALIERGTFIGCKDGSLV